MSCLATSLRLNLGSSNLFLLQLPPGLHMALSSHFSLADAGSALYLSTKNLVLLVFILGPYKALYPIILIYSYIEIKFLYITIKMSQLHYRYMEVDSTYRDRTRYPHPSKFSVQLSQTGPKANGLTALD